ncbi:hypothetical protein C4K38_0193 [Pseudomonas chlororaphis subsp. piscium]|nr:hypothetical protein C4K38_0193 [Pseudomonas chlororaphis subsp. piscium]AZD52020.1 hypothetical protein C4K19_0201 [Pseudomonas chlororaphis subsp. aurantiaca]AZC47809.1 hypothetical protein C4K35_0194 [Pseudomonas chlororaphis subsp. piscium]AZC54390.1 hypothetical protein C4K34_0193 [Pseudomonas chlororaphis subsp. piscium]AZC66887.1 hypothetical protein C4K32_0193 [Pseudomonas chlororaphis subsp. piscium]
MAINQRYLAIGVIGIEGEVLAHKSFLFGEQRDQVQKSAS